MNPLTRMLRQWGAAGAAENARSSVLELRSVDHLAEAVARRVATRPAAGRRPRAAGTSHSRRIA